MPETEMSDEQQAARAYERWLDKIAASDPSEDVRNGEPDVFLAGWRAGRDWQTGYAAAGDAVEAAPND